MRLGNQKRISAEMLGVGKSKVWFDTEHMTEIKEAITKGDVRTLIRKRIIQRRPELGHSRVRARKRLTQRRKGRQKCQGTSKYLKEYGWKGYGRNTPAGYLVGYLFGMKAQGKKIQDAILDQGLYLTRQGTIAFSVLKGLIDSGMKIPHDAKIFPHEDRILGKHISEEISKQFSAVKANIQKVK